MANPPTGTLTFLFTDIEGSTRLWEHDAQAMQAALARHDELLRLAIEVRGGYVFKTVGDAFCAVFPTAPDALEAALEIQRTLLSSEWEQSGPLRVRMALHTGAAEERDGDYFGPPLNRVARLLSAAHGEQVLLSSASQEMVRDHLPAGAALMDLGEHRLKDLFRPERVFQLLAPELPSEFPPLRTLEAYRNNLPLQPTPLIGREKEVAELCQRLSRPEVRLLTLTGAGGTGKTRLALQAAAELTEEFEEGVFFVSLATISDPHLVVGVVAATLGVKEAGGQPLLESLEYYLDEKHILLIVDNFEQVLEAAPVVSELLSAAPNLKVLATSRIPLRLYGEHEYSVPPLALPDPQRPSSVESLTQYEAVRLFVERAQAAKDDFSVTNENAPAVAEICYRLDGLPLAIELAAARIKVLSPQKMLGRLGNRLKLLTGGARDLPERQRTLRSTIEWSYGLLEEGEKVLFARLSVFAGGRTLEAIEAICDAEGDLPVDAFEGVSSLVDKNLLRQEEGPNGEPRFVMLETIHEYAREKLGESAEAEEIKRVHARYFLALAEEMEPKLKGAESRLWLERLEVEHDNLRAALLWSADTGDRETELRLAAALWWFWLRHDHMSEGRRWLEDALERAGTSARTAARAKVLCGAGFLAFSQINHPAARSRLEESAEIYREIGDRRGLAHALAFLSLVIAHQGELAPARLHAEESVRLFREEGEDRWGLGIALTNMGIVAEAQADYDQAFPLFEESAAILRELGDRWLHSIPLRHLGVVASRQGDHALAERLYKESLASLRALGEMLLISLCLEELAGVACAQGEHSRAARLWGAEEIICEAIGSTVRALYLADHERDVSTARADLGQEAFETAWAQGRAMAPEQAIEYALSNVQEERRPPTLDAVSEQQPAADERAYTLTRREQEVALHVARGLTNRQIATELSISERTVHSHLRNILKKLGLDSCAGLATWVNQQGLH